MTWFSTLALQTSQPKKDAVLTMYNGDPDGHDPFPKGLVRGRVWGIRARGGPQARLTGELWF